MAPARQLRLLALATCAVPACTGATDTSCRDVSGLVCGANDWYPYYYCDPCGQTWVCPRDEMESWAGYADWRSSEADCACVGIDGSLDTGDELCGTGR
jgi:hypothetical protein